MYKKTIIILLLTSIVNLLTANPTLKEIKEGWKFKQERGNNWLPASVPGVVHTDLIANGIIEDPFYRLNERGVQWVDKEDWIYETELDLSSDMMSKNNLYIHFKGLDTYADVYLNDQKILVADNMFREWSVDIKSLVKEKDNILKIYFHSPLKVDIPKWDANPIKYPAQNDQSENGGVFDKKVSIYARKAGYHYGWDWGPRLVTSGIWRSVIVEAWDDAKIDNTFIHQKEVTTSNANIQTTVEVLADKELLDATVLVKDNATNKILGSTKTNLKKGQNKIIVEFDIKEPTLWWSNGLGDPHLYTFATELRTQNKVLDSELTKVGIRSLKLINKPDKEGTNLYFELNGEPIFAKGANFIPCDNFLPRITKETYEQTILDAVNANMNMLRVWGGGIYEDDLFYDLCDKHGILVWQDFMFACSMYPADETFLESVRSEAVDNIKRLRNHASLALWCGNNEIIEAWYGWGWEEGFSKNNPEHAALMWKQYDDLFHHMLAEVVDEYAPNSSYRASSPMSREDGISEPNHGDSHYWKVWHGKEPIEEYNVERSRFFSEYGFQSFPEFESVKMYAPKEEDWAIESEVMMAHQRGGSFANSLINDYLVKNYKETKDFPTFLYVNQVLQGDAIKTAIESHRRDMPYCMGSLYWQHNDCWPVASWSSRDYYGQWKAQHYFAKKAFDDILVSPIQNGNNVDFYIISDRLMQVKGQLEVRIIHLNGKILNTINKNVVLLANTSTKVFSQSLKRLLGKNKKEEIVIRVDFIPEGKTNPYSNSYFLEKPKDLQFHKASITKSIAPKSGGYEVTLESDKYIRAAFISFDGIDDFVEDNYFDILPNEEITVRVNSKKTLEEFEKQLKIQSLNDMY